MTAPSPPRRRTPWSACAPQASAWGCCARACSAREELRRRLAGVRAAASNLSLGLGGVLFTGGASATLQGRPDAPLLVRRGLGGRDICAEELCQMAAQTRRAASEGRAPEPQLYTESGSRSLQSIAHFEREPGREP